MKKDFIMVASALIATFIFIFILHIGGYEVSGLEGFFCYSLFYIMGKIDDISHKLKDKK